MVLQNCSPTIWGPSFSVFSVKYLTNNLSKMLMDFEFSHVHIRKEIL
uniref:Uncharacterized protein n=1 Tax=Arundo donax TaxID=35708 RepID=A0A0A9DU12_ARUDO